MKKATEQLILFVVEPSTPSVRCGKIRTMDAYPNLPPVTSALASLINQDPRSLLEIAEGAGLSRSNLSRYLDGTREPRSHNLAALELSMGVQYGTTYEMAAKIAKGRKHVVRVTYAA